MMPAHPQMDTVFDFENDAVNTLVIENPGFFRDYLRDIDYQIRGYEGLNVLSEDNEPIGMSGHAEIIDSFLNFEINRKNLITKLISRMEALSVSKSYYVRTSELMSKIEQYILDLSLDSTTSVSCSKICIGGILRSAGIEISDDYENDLERLLDYMEIVRELEKDKLFIIVNLRSYYDDDDVEAFLSSVIGHGFHVLLVDSISKNRLTNESRVTIDYDLCEF